MIPYLELKSMTAMHSEEIEHAVRSVIRRGWYLLGEEVKNFEEAYARFIGTSHCVACGNGLDALRLILMAYKAQGRLHEGDEVIVPANTYIATILAITETGLKPVLVEPSLETLQIDDTLIEQHLTSRTKAVMIVHLYGKCAFTHRISDICKRHNLLLFEDNAQAHGCHYNGQKLTGSLGNAAAHSFYPGKNLGALGDAGAVTTDDEEIADIIRTLANYGSQRKYVFRYQGINSRMDEMQAAVLSVKLRHLNEDNRLRHDVAMKYISSMSNPLISLPYGESRKPFTETDNVFHIFPVLCERRDELQDWLKAKGIQSMIHYPIPPHKQECYEKELSQKSFPITERIAMQELSLPIAPFLQEDEVQEVINAVNSFGR